MKDKPMTDDSHSIDQLVEQLRHDWNQLSSLDCAQAVARIRRSGRSIRSIGRDLGRSEASLRHLLSGLKAPAADLAAARRGEISFNELVRRAKNAEERRLLQAQKAAQKDRQRQAIQCARLISNWPRQEHLGGSRGETIALESRSKLIADYAAGALPYADPQVVHPAAEWIERCRPETPLPDDTSYIDWYALWLARWSFCFCRDAELAIDALAIVGNL